MPAAAVRPICNATTKTGTPCRFASKENSTKCGHHTNWTPPLPQCNAIKPSGTQCTNTSRPGAAKCYVHRNATTTTETTAPRVVPRCTKGLCRREVLEENARGECILHARIHRRKEDHKQRVAVYRRIWQAYMRRRGGGEANMFAVHYHHAISVEYRRCAMQAYRSILPLLQGVSDEMIEAAVDAFPVRTDAAIIEAERTEVHRPAAVEGSLAYIAASTQNIHTRQVVDQSKRGMDFLLAVEVPLGQQRSVLDELKALWPAATMAPMHADIRTWWNKETCFAPGDWMYRRLLTSLWVYVKSQTGERRAELEKRMLEECREAMRMCCQGHTNRLVNVLCGFVDGIQFEQSKSEILQERFALIGNIEDEEQRYIEATRVIAELGIDADEAGPWLDAIATE